MMRTCAARLIRGLNVAVKSSSIRSFYASPVHLKDSMQVVKDETYIPEEILANERGIGVMAGLETGESEEIDPKFLARRYIAYFSNPKNDGWNARQAMNDLMVHPAIPEPEVTKEVLHCCRRMNDYALAVRYIEAVQHLMQNQKSVIWPWYLQEIEGTLKELGISTPEEMGYDKPEFFMEEPEDMHY